MPPSVALMPYSTVAYECVIVPNAIRWAGLRIAMNDDPDAYSEEETERRREAALARMLTTPHRPQEKLKKGDGKPGD